MIIKNSIAILVVILATGVANSAEPPPKEKLAPDALKKKFYRCWLETERVKTGVSSKDPYELVGGLISLVRAFPGQIAFLIVSGVGLVFNSRRPAGMSGGT